MRRCEYRYKKQSVLRDMSGNVGGVDGFEEAWKGNLIVCVFFFFFFRGLRKFRSESMPLINGRYL